MIRKKSRYKNISEEIRKRIIEGVYPSESRLPTESEFASEFTVSRGTIREALLLLEDEGFIVRMRGSGSFVSRHAGKIVSGIENLESWTETIVKAGHKVVDQVLSIDFLPLEREVAEWLNVPVRSPGISIRSLRIADDYPLIYAEDLIPSSLLINADVWKVRESTHSILGFFEKIGYAPQKFVTTLQAVNANQLASIMNVEPVFPLVLLEGVLYDTDHRPLSYSCYYFRSDKYRFSMVRNKR